MKTKHTRISSRLSSEQRQTIEEKIGAGEYRNLSEFLRGAIEKALAAQE